VVAVSPNYQALGEIQSFIFEHAGTSPYLVQKEKAGCEALISSPKSDFSMNERQRQQGAF